MKIMKTLILFIVLFFTFTNFFFFFWGGGALVRNLFMSAKIKGQIHSN